MRVASRRRHPSTDPSFRNPKRRRSVVLFAHTHFFLFDQSDASRPSTSSRHDATRDARARRATRSRRAAARRAPPTTRPASALERRDDAASGRDVAVDLAVVDALRRAPTDDERARWRKYTREDVAAHARLADGWIVVNERVFDITAFATTHPGFQQRGAGVDGAGDRAGARERGER